MCYNVTYKRYQIERFDIKMSHWKKRYWSVTLRYVTLTNDTLRDVTFNCYIKMSHWNVTERCHSKRLHTVRCYSDRCHNCQIFYLGKCLIPTCHQESPLKKFLEMSTTISSSIKNHLRKSFVSSHTTRCQFH